MTNSSNTEKLQHVTRRILMHSMDLEFTYEELCNAIIKTDKDLKLDCNIIGSIARKLGYERKRKRIKGNRFKNFYFFPKIDSD